MTIASTRTLMLALLLVVTSALSGAGAVAAESPDAKQESSRVRYARVYVALARLDLQVAKMRNERAPNTIPRALLAVLEEHVALAEEWLRQAESETAGKPYNVALKATEIMAGVADVNYAKALEINRVSPLQPEALQRLRLKAELAHLAVENAKTIDPNSPLSLLQFQMERLREDVAELTRQQTLILDRN